MLGMGVLQMANLGDRQSMQGKVAIVTGGGGGIGSEVCKAFVGEGAATAVADMDLERARTVADEITSSGGSALPVQIDVTSRDSVYSAVQQVVDHFGRIDFLVHCAGNNILGSILEISLEQWNSSIDIHLTGAFLCCQAVGKQLVKQGDGGRVVLMSSVTAMSPVPDRGAYSPAKAGLVNIAKLLSLEWARYNINVNAVCPGITTTPMVKLVYEREPWLQEQRLKRMPMGREASPEEVADLVVFLCSDRSSYINGTAIPVDGSWLNSGFLPEPQ
jgi:NAD(P)-dependent dehydrogenase (short-subunit alcohol dehydrogenase family)